MPTISCYSSLIFGFDLLPFWLIESLYQEIVTLSVQINVIFFSAGFGFLINTSYICDTKHFSKH